MADELADDIHGLSSEFQAIEKSLKSIVSLMQNFSSKVSGTSAAVGSSQGAGQLGLGTSSSGSVMPSSLSSVSTIMSANAMFAKSAAKKMLGVDILTALGSGVASGMPDVSATLGYSAMNYQTAISSPGYNWNQIGRGTSSMMAGGMTSAGSSALVGAILSNSGIGYGSGRYSTLARSVAGAAMGFGVDNQTAATSFAGMTQANTANTLMSNFGILANNPLTGKAASPTDIYKSLYQRITGGKMTASQIQDSMANGGYIAYDIQNSGLDQAGQGMFYKYMLAAAQGKAPDLANASSMKAYAAASGGNPTQSLLDINSSNTKLMQTAATTYVDAMNNAAAVTKQFTDVLSGFLQTGPGRAMLSTNAFLSGTQQSTGGNALLTTGAGVLGGLMQYKLASSLISKIGGGTASSSGASASSLGASGGWLSKLTSGSKLSTFLKGGMFSLGATLGGDAIKSITGNKQGSIGNKIGNALSTAGEWSGMASLLNIFGPEVGVPAMLAAGGLGAIVGGFQGGTKSTVSATGLTDTTGALRLVAPVKGPITTKYGQRTDIHGTALWGGKPHLAIDYGVPVGTTVQAAADGTVQEVGSGSGDRSYGNYVILDHGNGYTTTYAHLNSYSVSKGQSVVRGQAIALSGATGYVTGPHLHFEVRKNGVPINPSSLGMGSAVSVVAGNASTSASNGAASSSSGASDVGGSSAQAGWGSTGLNTGWTGSVSIPSSYSGTSIGSASVSKRGGNYSSIATNTGYGSNGAGSSTGQGGPDLAVGGKGTQVTINVTVQQASAEEAKRLAEMVKTELEKDKLVASMGRM